MLVMDSGLGGLSVVRALRRARPGIALGYLADTAGFPYGARDPGWLSARAQTLLRAALAHGPLPGAIVVACNTLSTLALTDLRAEFGVPIVGTVPAIKLAARVSRSRRFTVLATPNTAHSAYAQGLIEEFAHDCVVDNYGAPSLAEYAEAMLRGQAPDGDLAAQLAPAFHDDARGRTDAIVLGCTHYPLIVSALQQAAPWPVSWIDASDAIARRALSVARADVAAPESVAWVTHPRDQEAYAPVFAREGFAHTRALALP